MNSRHKLGLGTYFITKSMAFTSGFIPHQNRKKSGFLLFLYFQARDIFLLLLMVLFLLYHQFIHIQLADLSPSLKLFGLSCCCIILRSSCFFASQKSILTWMCGSRFDLNGRAAPAVLLHLRHPLAGHLVGVLCRTHGNLVLDDALTFQLFTAVTARQKHRAVEPQGSLLAIRKHCKN